ncbi:hypothetical protein BDN67DRAFT_955732 [Paxillus ammoniavirescens]|nr:hypothetical protein BDN67DRAFT_955732 [Paxillus ammoniavirescens]
MPGWTMVDSSPTEGRTFKRPLDVTECGFFWDAAFNGTADSLHHVQLRLLNREDAYIFSESNITRAWLSVKRRYPLVNAWVDVDDEEPQFVVEEHRLGKLNPNEISFGNVSSLEAAQRRVLEILDGPRPLSHNLLARMYVFRQRDRPDVIHLFSLIAHCVTDGVANITFTRCFLDTLSSHPEPPISSLEQRLSMVIASADLEPRQPFSPAKQRWRRAIGYVLYQLMIAKRQGGHTLPCRLTHATPRIAASSRIALASLSQNQTSAIMINCRLNNITFGNAFLPLAQVAMTRVLYRRYLRGEISGEEWEYRKKQPHISGGPLNLRPYLDQEWLAKGGHGEFLLAISFLFYQLPFMTLGMTTRQHREELVLCNGAPPFAHLLTFHRFLHRANMVKQQVDKFLYHPLFLEIAGAAHLDRLEITRFGALAWMKSIKEGTTADEGEVLAAIDFPGATWAHGGSSMGNMDHIFPVEYPLGSSNPISPRSNIRHPVKAGYIIPPMPDTSEDKFRIFVEYSRIHLHTRPGELYLGAATSRGRLHMSVYYDGNVYEETVVREWLDEVKDAVVWYLGQSHADDGSVRAKM